MDRFVGLNKILFHQSSVKFVQFTIFVLFCSLDTLLKGVNIWGITLMFKSSDLMIRLYVVRVVPV